MNKDKEPEKPSAPVEEQATPEQYMLTVRTALANKNHKVAFAVLQHARVIHPDDPLILSYFGYVQAAVDKKFRTGVETCKRAIVMLRKNKEFDERALSPVLYLNLGRAYLAADKKKEAIEAFHTGLTYNSRQADILKELKQLGTRAKPPIAFLGRSNPINMIIGKVLRGGKKTSKPGGRGAKSR